MNYFLMVHVKKVEFLGLKLISQYLSKSLEVLAKYNQTVVHLR